MHWLLLRKAMTTATFRLWLSRLKRGWSRYSHNRVLRGGTTKWAMAVGVAALAVTVSARAASPPSPAPPSVGVAPQPEPEELTTLSILDGRLHRAWPDDALGVAWFGSGGYELFAREPGQFVAIRAPLASAVDDVVLSGTFRKIGGPPGGGYGLIVRDQRHSASDGIDQSGDFLVAAVGDRGDVGVWRREGQHWLDLVPWTASSSVRAGASQNELRVRATGNHLYFDVNGSPVANLDVPLESGRVGLFVGGDQNHVLVEKLVVQPLLRARQQQPVAQAPAPIVPAPARAIPPPASSGGRTNADDTQLPDQAVQILAAVQSLSRDLDSDQPALGKDVARVQHARALIADIEQDVFAIFRAFGYGLNSPTSPVNSPTTLADAAAHLKSASTKADELRVELDAIRAAHARDGQ